MKRLIMCVCSVFAAVALILSLSGNKCEGSVEGFVENVEALAESEVYCGPFCVDDEGLCVYIYFEWDLVDIFDGVLLPYYG